MYPNEFYIFMQIYLFSEFKKRAEKENVKGKEDELTISKIELSLLFLVLWEYKISGGGGGCRLYLIFFVIHFGTCTDFFSGKRRSQWRQAYRGP